MEASQVLILVSILFGLGGLLLGFLLGSAWAGRRQHGEPAPQEPLETAIAEESPETAEPVSTPAAGESTLLPDAPDRVDEPNEPEPADLPAMPVSPSEPALAEMPSVPAAPPEPVLAAAEPPTALQPEKSAKPVEKKQPQKPAAPPTILEQINEIFGKMTAGTPLAERGIRLVQDPTLGVTVEVGTERYESIDSVPDDEIRAALKAAVKKWEEG